MLKYVSKLYVRADETQNLLYLKLKCYESGRCGNEVGIKLIKWNSILVYWSTWIGLQDY